MATPLFDAFVVKVRQWANRDIAVLPDSLITDFLDYSADVCYRKLRIPPLEYTYTYAAITEVSEGETYIQLPPDLTEIIQFRKLDSEGDSINYDQKLSLPVFEDRNTNVNEPSYVHKGGNIVINPPAKIGDVFEVHYYRRLPDLDATYTVNQANLDAGNLEEAQEGDPGAVDLDGTWYIGKEVGNWLRDENDRVLLWGALAYAFDYLGEDERANMYREKQAMAIQELNQEEVWRKVRGGSCVITYQTAGLI